MLLPPLMARSTFFCCVSVLLDSEVVEAVCCVGEGRSKKNRTTKMTRRNRIRITLRIATLLIQHTLPLGAFGLLFQDRIECPQQESNSPKGLFFASPDPL